MQAFRGAERVEDFDAEALTEALALLTAVTVCAPGCVPGVKSPAEETVPVVALPPLFPSTCQVTPALDGSLKTVLVNCTVCVADKVTAARLGLTTTVSTPCVTVIVAEDDFVLSPIDVAVRVRVAGLGTFSGAV